MLHLHHADRLEPLLDALADLLAVPPADPFEADVVAVPAAGIRDAAMVGLGRRLGVSAPGSGDGIWANVEFLFPGRFMARAIGDPTRDGEPELDPWRLPRLTWAVLEELAAGTVDVPGGDVEVRWALARHIADLFDRYATQRARLVECWAEGIDSDGTHHDDGSPALLDESQRWQAQLWRAVRARIGAPSPPERLPALLADIRDGTVRPDLPSRVAVFGVGSLAPTMQQLLVALAAQREVHVFLRHPSMSAWERSPHRLAGGLNVRANLDVTIAAANPLLASWGRPALESRAMVHGLPGVHEVPHTVAALPPATLLQALQHSIRVDAKPEPVAGVIADPSLQVHACHGEVRQLEVLRDALARAFVDDPTLQPHEVLVLCPALDRIGPLVEAVFAQGAVPVPVRVGDRSLTTDEPVVDALQAALALVSGRATLSEVLALVQFEPVRRRFGWSIEQVEQFAEWSEQLGARWGLLPEHRVEWGLPSDLGTGTWRQAVDQLLAGVAMAAPAPRMVLGDVAPFDDLGTDDAVLAGSVADLLARLIDLHDAVQGERAIDAWVELLHRAVDEFTAPGDDPSRRQAVHRELTDVLRSATSPGTGLDGDPVPCPVPLSLADVQALLRDTLADRPGRLPLRSGSVTVSSLVPQHGVPARVVCLLGLDDGAVRAGTFDGDDVLGVRPCVGERHPRHESRQLLLDAVLAAGERLIVTCNGFDLTTNKELPFIVPLVELLEVVGRFAPATQRLAEQVVVRHPRHGFNERTLQPGLLGAPAGQPFTFDSAMLRAAMARRGALEHTRPAASSWLLSMLPVDAVELDDLVEAAGNPARIYLQRRLDVAVPREASVSDDGLAIAVTPLGISQLGRSLLDARRQGGAADEWVATCRLDGSLPPGELSSAVLATVCAEVEAFEATAQEWGIPLAGGDELLVDVRLDAHIDDTPLELTVLGKVTGVVPGPEGPRVVDVRFSRPRPSFRLGMALRVAAAQLHDPAQEWSGVLITRSVSSSSKQSTSAEGLQMRGAGSQRQQSARELLVMAVQLWSWARRDAVPFFDRASFDLATAAIGDAYDHLDTDLDDRFQGLLWPDASVEGLQRDPLLPTDPAVLGSVGVAARAEAVARWVWDTFDRCVEVVATVDGDEDGDE